MIVYQCKINLLSEIMIVYQCKRNLLSETTRRILCFSDFAVEKSLEGNWLCRGNFHRMESSENVIFTI
jgi:hypothetical protein